MTKEIKILAIESSCDETAAAVVVNGRDLRSNVISSQIDLHTLYGGVVPEIASRKHIEKIKAEKNRLSDRQKSIENNIENMKSNLQKAMVLTGKTKFSTSLFNFNIAKNPPSVIIDDESKIPQEYLIPQPAKIDKTAIKNLLKNLSDNDKITFAHLEQKESLRIK